MKQKHKSKDYKVQLINKAKNDITTVQHYLTQHNTT